jgi:hypothetical protein
MWVQRTSCLTVSCFFIKGEQENPVLQGWEASAGMTEIVEISRDGGLRGE